MIRIGRNDPCPCGSGKKYKHCCSQNGKTPAADIGHQTDSINNAIQSALEHHMAGHLPQAEAIYQQILQIAPEHPSALHLSGVLANQMGKKELAIELISKALMFKPDYAEAHNNLGTALLDQGNSDAAIGSYRRAISLNPNFADAHNNLGTALYDQGKLDEAIEHYHRALSIKPDFADAHYNLGAALYDQGKFDAAIESYRRAISINPDYADAHYNLGNALKRLGLLDEAVGCYHKALALKPDYTGPYVGLAAISMDTGQFEAAQTALSRALKYKPELPAAWAMLTSLRKMTLEDSDWLNTALKLVSQEATKLSKEEACNLQFAIGKYYDDTKQYGLAFPAYQQANALKRQMRGGVDRAEATRLVDSLITIHTPGFMARQWKEASQSQRPVLIVGMPRSGTSLIEQIIATHPDAFGAGELAFWEQQATANTAAIFSGNYDSALIAKMAVGYEQCLQWCSADAARIVDKMPLNFVYLGLIHAAFPQARIIHAQRNPVDTCVSIFFTDFNSGHSYSTDIEDLAFFYREYARLMRHWRSVLPADQFLEVPYEALIDDHAGWIRRIIEFTGLDWDERCLDFHKTERKVGTASNWQVRQKIYRTSTMRWHHYENHLGSLLGLLDLNVN